MRASNFSKTKETSFYYYLPLIVFLFCWMQSYWPTECLTMIEGCSTTLSKSAKILVINIPSQGRMADEHFAWTCSSVLNSLFFLVIIQQRKKSKNRRNLYNKARCLCVNTQMYTRSAPCIFQPILELIKYSGIYLLPDFSHYMDQRQVIKH